MRVVKQYNTNFKFLGISFENVNKRVVWRWEHEAILLDMDGTLTGSEAGSSVVPNSGLLDEIKCTVSISITFNFSFYKIKGL